MEDLVMFLKAAAVTLLLSIDWDKTLDNFFK